MAEETIASLETLSILFLSIIKKQLREEDIEEFVSKLYEINRFIEMIILHFAI